MSDTQLLVLVVVGVLLASPAFPQSPDSFQTRIVRPVTITTAGGRTYIVGVQRYVLEPLETPPPAPPQAPAAKASTPTGTRER